MTGTPTNADEPPTSTGRTGADSPALAATIAEYEGEPNVCTLHLADAVDDELVTNWISAEEGSYVALEEMR